jgi:hypothetical protein
MVIFNRPLKEKFEEENVAVNKKATPQDGFHYQ